MTYLGNDNYEINIGTVQGTFNKKDLLDLVYEMLDSNDYELQRDAANLFIDYDNRLEESNCECFCSEGDFDYGFEEGEYEAWEQYNKQKESLMKDLIKVIKGWK